MPEKEDLIGQRFGRLVVVAEHPKTNGRVSWLCHCDCGNDVVVKSHNLKSGSVKSCGCLAHDMWVERRTKHKGCLNHERLYHIWSGMKARCLNSECKAYALYGGRGITMCAEWAEDYSAFRKWALENGYSDDLTIDRIDNDLGYYPDNCRWANMKTQCNNRRSNVVIKCFGQLHTIAEWGDITGLDQDVIQQRLKRGRTPEEALGRPLRTGIYTCEGMSMSLPEWSRLKGINVGTLLYRLSHGWELERALNTPSRKSHDAE